MSAGEAPIVRPDEEEDLHPLKVAGEVARSVSRISSGSLQLAVMPGLQEIDEEDVEILVPILSCEFDGEFGPESEKATVGTTLMFDNVAFLAMRMLSDFESSMEQLRRLSGELSPSPERIALASEWIAQAGLSAKRIQGLLADISGDPGEETGHPPEEV